LAAAGVAWRQWPARMAQIDSARTLGLADCARRYSASDARQRCDIVFELVHTQQRAIAIFNRVALSLSPLLMAGGFAFWALRRRP
ncbi:MAG: hypothetical protein ACPGVX_01640, partial [Thalassobaculaceae bacterium]